MADGDLPLLLFARPTSAERNRQSGGAPKIHNPPAARQAERIAPKLEVLQQAFDAKRLRLQQAPGSENPELVVVFETVGSIQDFAAAVSKVAGLEWLVEWDEEDIAPDGDFYDERHLDRGLVGRIFLIGSNKQALDQLLALWKLYVENPLVKFPRGQGPWRHVFKQLKDIRYWSVTDRAQPDVLRYWADEVALQRPMVRFEIDAWYFQSQQKNQAAYDEIRSLLEAQGGHTIQRYISADIQYHGVLAELPPQAIQEVLNGAIPELMLSDRIMFFRPRAQALRGSQQDGPVEVLERNVVVADGQPIVALLDGLPQQNHPLLAQSLVVDDPDGWEGAYEVKDRVHGTAMASLIVHGELDEPSSPLTRRIYVRPLLRPSTTDVFGDRRAERTPDDVLLIDLIHRAVRRLFEAEGNSPPAAPTVRIVNLSIGNEFQVFDRALSPLARLLDWLAAKYGVLFVVSAGNIASTVTLPIAQGTLQGTNEEEQQRISLDALLSDPGSRRLISPAEAINVITVGATHTDSSAPPVVPGRFDLFQLSGVSPISRIGYGFRRSVKPDILMPGGRTLFLERLGGNAAQTRIDVVSGTRQPGHRVAIPPLPGDAPSSTAYGRGTSHAAALATRHAARLYEVIAALRVGTDEVGPQYDGVLLKAMLAHGADWTECCEALLAARPALVTNTEKQEFLGRWLGYGPVEVDRALVCTETRATMLGVGEVLPGEALVFSAPLPPSLAGRIVLRRLVVTLAWFSPINPSSRNYRRARLWITPPYEELRVGRGLTVFHKATQRGTLQHEVLEGEQAAVFADGDRMDFKVNCSDDAGPVDNPVRFALCVSLEVPIDAGIPVYQEIRDRIALPVGIQPRAS
jgi:hypothetical protein